VLTDVHATLRIGLRAVRPASLLAARSGILHVSAVDSSDPANRSHITISNEKSRLTASDISSMLLESQLFAAVDGELEELICAKQSLLAYAAVVRNTCTEEPATHARIDAAERAQVFAELDALESWVALHEAAAADDHDDAESSSYSSAAAIGALTASDFDARQKALEVICQPILKKLFSIDPRSSATTADAALHSTLAEALAAMTLKLKEQPAQ
jgi:molecular chaperone DnaK (HSP70)